MPLCSYLVIPQPGATAAVAARLTALNGCEVTIARNHELILLVTETEGPERERELRAELEAIDGILSMVLTFGELDPRSPSGVASSAEDRR